MSMTTEQALAYMHSDEQPTVADSNTTPSVEESKSEDINVDSPNEIATNNDGEHTTEEVNKAANAAGSDEPKTEDVDVDKTNKKEVHDHKAQRDYAFIKQKNKLKALQERYDRDTSTKDKRIKELEEELNKRKLLTSDNFTKADGSKDIDAYWNWKSDELKLINEANSLKSERSRDQRDYEIELDRINTERCFQGKDLEEYNNLIMSKGQGFAEAIHEKDKNNVVFSYLDTVQDYPIVLKELMTNPTKWLPTIFRSTDEYSLKHNTAKVTDAILDNYYNSKNKQVDITTKSTTAIPVIGKQISNAGATSPDNSGSLLNSINSINNYLRKHKRR